MKRFRIGLDIDDCLADFWGAYCEYFDTKTIHVCSKIV